MPRPGGYWLTPAAMASRASSSMNRGPSVSGKPWPRLTDPVEVASADISAKIVVVADRTRSAFHADAMRCTLVARPVRIDRLHRQCPGLGSKRPEPEGRGETSDVRGDGTSRAGVGAGRAADRREMAAPGGPGGGWRGGPGPRGGDQDHRRRGRGGRRRGARRGRGRGTRVG